MCTFLFILSVFKGLRGFPCCAYVFRAKVCAKAYDDSDYIISQSLVERAYQIRSPQRFYFHGRDQFRAARPLRKLFVLIRVVMEDPRRCLSERAVSGADAPASDSGEELFFNCSARRIHYSHSAL